ncbi:MAG: YbaB/EbfC family nucleoid-associated protein [Oscillospiraceae bacterium]|nr:YbaB/EbfC family nucleoid-associated protein [Oscillospiraceae bacterium]
MAKHYGGGGGMNTGMIKQMQKMQQDMLRTQEELEEQTYVASSGGGVVTATVTGKRDLTALEIKPEAVDPEDVEMLQDLVVAAVGEAQRQAEAAMAEGMGKFTKGMNLPF